MDIFYNQEKFEAQDTTTEEIEYFDVKTPKATMENGEQIYWCPFAWNWRPIVQKGQMEKRYKNCLKTIYFNEKLFFVEKKSMRKHFKDGKLVDVTLLPIGVYVFWNNVVEEWEFLGYK